MKASDLIEQWENDDNPGQKDNINALNKYIRRLHSKKPITFKLPTGDRAIESDRIQLQTIYEFERTMTDNITLIGKPKEDTDQGHLLSVALYRNPSLFYHCSFAYDGKINPRIISQEVSELDLPLEIEGKKVKDNDVIFIYLHDEKDKVDNVLDGLCKQNKIKHVLSTHNPKILILILIKSPSVTGR